MKSLKFANKMNEITRNGDYQNTWHLKRNTPQLVSDAGSGTLTVNAREMHRIVKNNNDDAYKPEINFKSVLH